MSTPIQARYCDGERLRSHPVAVHLLPDATLLVVGGNLERVLPLASATVSERLGRTPRFLRFTSGAVLEVEESDDFSAWLATVRASSAAAEAIHWFESRSCLAAVATLLVVACAVATFWQGLPRLARRAAYATPVTIEQQVGVIGYGWFAQTYPATKLRRSQQRRVQKQLERLLAARTFHVVPQVAFIDMPMPNAFALPGGTIVITDQLVGLATNDDQLAGVLAHELGHIELRHGLRSILRNSSALIVVSTLTGDLSSLVTFSGTLPFILLQYGYAREFEREADDFAAALLPEAHIDPAGLAEMLAILERARPEKGADFTYLSTHPSTPERLRRIGALPRRPAVSQEKVNLSPFASPSANPLTPLVANPRDSHPVPLSTPPPVYPPALHEAGVTGQVMVQFTIDTEGRTRDLKVLSSSPPGFEDAALEAIKTWRFVPARKDGAPNETVAKQQIDFGIEGISSPTTHDEQPASEFSDEDQP